MVKEKRILFLAFALTAMGCAATLTREPAADAELATIDTLTPEVHSQLIEAQLPAVAIEAARSFAKQVKATNLTQGLNQLCLTESSHYICKTIAAKKAQAAPSSSASSGLTHKELVGHLRQKNLAELKSENLGRMLAVFKPLTKEQLAELAGLALESKSCLHHNTYIALASTHELYFPAEEQMKNATELFRKVRSCEKGERARFASYRAGVFSLLKKNPKAARADFEFAATEPSDFFYTRAQFLLNQTKIQLRESALKPAQFVKRFPLSHYATIYSDESGEIVRSVLKRSEPYYQTREPQLPDITRHLEWVESFLHLKEENLARYFLSQLQAPDLRTSNPRFQVYVAYLLNSLEMDLNAFFVLTQLFSLHPQVISKTTMKFYFPLRYFDKIEKHAGTLDPYLVAALIRQESAYNPTARSPKNARGLMQLLPSTASRFGLARKQSLFDPETNIRVGTRFLSHLMDRFDGNIIQMLAGYNAGPGHIEGWKARYPAEDEVLFSESIPFRETRDYVSLIQRNLFWYKTLYPNAVRVAKQR